MRTLKLIAVAMILAFAGAVYAAGAMQDAATKTQEAAKPSKSCCMKHGGAKAATHDATKHVGKGCCSAEGAGGCCGDSCSKEHHKGGRAVAQKTAVGVEKAGCCSSDHSCCKEGAKCCEAHKAGNKQAAANMLGIYRPRLYSMIKKHDLKEYM